jgi:prepilin-type processing-associated H-X9-DG protein
VLDPAIDGPAGPCGERVTALPYQQFPHSLEEIMLDACLHSRSRRGLATALVAIVPLVACAPAVSTPATAPDAGATTLIVRLGADTLGVEQYTRTATRMEGVLVQRAPFTTIARYSVDLGAGNVPTHAEYSLRRGDGTTITGQMQSLSVRFNGDSVTFIGHRSSGDTTRSAAARGEIIPFLNGSYGLFELAIARLVATTRDSATFAIVPLSWGARGTSPLPVKLLGRDSARINWFGSPLYARHDGRGGLLWADGSQTTMKVRVDRVAAMRLDTLAREWSARDQTAGSSGPASTRDTVRATIGSANVWVDYGRPALRGRNVWVNGVLGDTIWRTGANAATQLRTDRELNVGGAIVPPGTYSLWTRTTANGYELIINRQAGQWGTEYHADRDLARVPLRESTVGAPVERFTIALDAGALTMTWGTKQLSLPVSVR